MQSQASPNGSVALPPWQPAMTPGLPSGGKRGSEVAKGGIGSAQSRPKRPLYGSRYLLAITQAMCNRLPFIVVGFSATAKACAHNESARPFQVNSR